MKSPTVENVLSVANDKKTKLKVKSQVKPQSGSGLLLAMWPDVGDQSLKFLSPTDIITCICEWVSGYLQPL